MKREELTIFLEQACYIGRDYRSTVARLYEAYVVWAAGRSPMGRNALTQGLRRQLPETVARYTHARIDGVAHRVFWGLGIRPQPLGFKPVDLPDSPAKMIRRRTPKEAPPSDQVYRFLAECLQTSVTGEAKSSDIYSAYIGWTVDVDEHAYTQHMLTRKINEVFRGSRSVRYGTHQFADRTIAKGYKGLEIK